MAAAAGRLPLPRARPEPRVLPNEPAFAVSALAEVSLTDAAGVDELAADSAGTGAGAGKSADASWGAPDFSGSDMCVLVYVRRLIPLRGDIAGGRCRARKSGQVV